MSAETAEYPFTHEMYKDMLSRFLDMGYCFSFFEDATELLDSGDPFILLRHDIDFDLRHLVPLLEIEQQLGIRSTVFIQVRSEFYNPFCYPESQIIADLVSAGHRIGLHCDCELYPVETDPEVVAYYCQRERQLLESWFEIDIGIVSFHRPAKNVLSADRSITGGVPHTYLPLFTKSITYCSDSTGEWRFGHPLDLQATADRRPLQILVHPVWWQNKNQSPQETLDMFVRQSGKRLQIDLAKCISPHRGS